MMILSHDHFDVLSIVCQFKALQFLFFLNLFVQLFLNIDISLSWQITFSLLLSFSFLVFFELLCKSPLILLPLSGISFLVDITHTVHNILHARLTGRPLLSSLLLLFVKHCIILFLNSELMQSVFLLFYKPSLLLYIILLNDFHAYVSFILPLLFLFDPLLLDVFLHLLHFDKLLVSHTLNLFDFSSLCLQ